MSSDLFRTRDHVADFDDKVAEYARQSAEVRSSLRKVTDIAYGPHPGQRLDIFSPTTNDGPLPVHMFVHGGYWRMFSKDDFSYIARTVTKAGGIAVVIDHTLMPAVRLADVVSQVRAARQWVQANITRYGGDAARFTVSGHSAGAHLAAFLFTADQLDPPHAALLLGGVYDIRPLQQSFLQPLIGLTDDEVSGLSPVDHVFHGGISVDILYGGRETDPFQTQAKRMGQRFSDCGCAVNVSALLDSDHMSSVLELGSPDSEASQRLTSLITGEPVYAGPPARTFI